MTLLALSSRKNTVGMCMNLLLQYPHVASSRAGSDDEKSTHLFWKALFGYLRNTGFQPPRWFQLATYTQ